MGTERGFTLLEVLVALAILGLVLLLFAPSFQAILARRQLTGAGEELSMLMRRARYDAIRLSQRTAVAFTPTEGFYVDGDLDGQLDLRDRQGGLVRPPAAVELTGPPGDASGIVGFSALGETAGPIFEPTGAVLAAGAFRISDRRGNHLEVRITESPAATAVLRKWDGSAWRAQGEGGVRWQWH